MEAKIKRNGREEKDGAMTIKKGEEAKKSKRPKILPKHLEFIVNSMQSSVNLEDLSCDGDGNEHLQDTLCSCLFFKQTEALFGRLHAKIWLRLPIY